MKFLSAGKNKMQQTRDESIDLITSNLVMSGTIEAHEATSYMEYLSTLENKQLAQCIAESRELLDNYYKTKWNLN